MSLLAAIIIGLIVGGIGGFLLQENFDLLVLNIVMGVAGGVLGGALYFIASSNHSLLFSWGGLVSELFGSLLFVLVFSFLHRAAPESISHENLKDK